MTAYYRQPVHSDPLIAGAIEEATRTHPYYGPAIARLRIVADDKVATMATSAEWVTHYNPATVAGWTPAERGAVLVHELEHLLRQHSERCGEREHQAWNVAADAEINQRLSGLPDGAVYPETLGMPSGQVAERYYNSAQSQGKDDGDSKPGDGKPGDGAGTGQPGPGEPGNCGSAAGGPTQEHEAGDAANPGDGAADGGAGARKDVAESVLGGSAPGTEEGTELRDWAEAELGIDRAAWYRALSTVIGRTMAQHGAPTRWIWPGRRDASDMGGAVLPRWTGQRPSCAVIIDTSSSVTPFDLDIARAAGHFIGRMADATFYRCTTRLRPLGKTLPDSITGGGGTDMARGIIDAIAEGAQAVIVITDCETDWYSTDDGTALVDTGVPVIIAANLTASQAMRDRPGWHYTPPEWMKVLPVVTEGN